MNVSILYFFFHLTQANPWLFHTAYFLSEYAIYVLPLSIFIYIFWVANKPFSKIFYILSVVCVAVFLAELLKHFFAVPRPFTALNFIPLIPETNFSFPSMHATFAGALAAGTFFSVSKHAYFTCGVIVLCFAIGLSRIMLGVHYPIDVVAGFVVGLLVALLGEKLV